MTGILLGLLAAVTWGGGDFLGGIYARRLPAAVVLFWGQLAGGSCILVVALLSGTVPTAAGIAWGVVGGLAGLFGLVALYRGLARGVMAIISPLSACGAIVPLGLALARGAIPPPIALAGIVLAFGGTLLSSLAPGHSTDLTLKRRSFGAQIRHSGALYGVAAAAGFGVFFVALAQGAATGTSALWVILGARACTVPLLALFCWRARVSLRIARHDLPGVLGSGVLDTAANTSFAYASTFGNLGLVSVLASLYPVTTVVLALILLRERLTPLQSVGIGLALAGVASMAAG